MKSLYLQPQLVSALRGYSKQQLAKDLIAGVIVAIIALPLSIALALASGNCGDFVYCCVQYE